MSDCRCTKYVGKDPCIHDLKTIVEEQAEAIQRVRQVLADFPQAKRTLSVKDLIGQLKTALDGISDTPNEPVSTLTANADISETSANADTDCQNSNETVAELARKHLSLKHDIYCPSRMGRLCECVLIAMARLSGKCPTCSDLRVQIVDSEDD